MTKRLLLTINYKTGTVLKQLVNFLHCEDGEIIYTIDAQVHDVVQKHVAIPLVNIQCFYLESVMCDGWNVVEGGE